MSEENKHLHHHLLHHHKDGEDQDDYKKEEKHRKHLEQLGEVAASKQTFSSLDDMLANADKPVLVDFYTIWNGPCQLMTPILNEVSEILKDKIQVVKIDIDKNPSIADKYKIEGLPTFILFKDGQPYDRFEGVMTREGFIQRIERSLQVKQ
ncbi:thioredoxin Y1 [Euphorbia peplus]|nr:thioredoxin Y1 [Euphorbia peplus]